MLRDYRIPYRNIEEGSLTGNRRFRQLHWRGLSGAIGLVLQVQINTWAQGREDKQGRWVTAWRDATPEDVSKEELV